MGAAVAQMFEQALEISRGWHIGYSLEKVLPLDSDLLASETEVPAGRCVYISNDGMWKLGPTGKAMPHWLWQGKNDPDVYNNGVSPVTGVRHFIGVSPGGNMRGIPGTAGVELQTTEFVAGTYTPNQLLKSNTSGKLTNSAVTLGTNLVVGVTSWMENQNNQTALTGTTATGPSGLNAHGVSVLTFYPCYQPGSESTGT